MQKQKKSLGQWISYMFVGGSSALVELTLFQVFVWFASFGVGTCNVIAVVIATVYNFLLNGKVTFQAATNSPLSAFKYLIVFLFNTAFSTVAVTVAAGVGAVPIFVKIATMACIVCWNFFLYKYFVFADGKSHVRG